MRSRLIINLYIRVRARLLRDLQPASFRRFTKHYRDYLTAVAKEAELREHGLVLDLESYQMLRRNNSAVWICFDLFGTDPLGNELTDGIYNHPIISSMFLACVDMVCWSNVSSPCLL